jgi:hypothetical protein
MQSKSIIDTNEALLTLLSLSYSVFKSSVRLLSLALVAQLVECSPRLQSVVGSNPT